MIDLFNAIFNGGDGGSFAVTVGELYAPTVAATAAAVVIIGFGAVADAFGRVLTIVLSLGGRER